MHDRAAPFSAASRQPLRWHQQPPAVSAMAIANSTYKRGFMKTASRTALHCVTAFLALTLPSPAQPAAREKGGLDTTGPYRVVENWFKPGVAQWNQPVTGVAVDNPNRIFVVSSGQQ